MKRNLFTILFFGWVLVSCTQPKSENNQITPTAIIQLSKIPPISTKLPTSTAAKFVLKPTSTNIPTNTPFSLEDSFGFGYGPRVYPDSMNPLTGLIIEDERLLERRPLAIKITNFPRSVRPQWGLMKADHVYEYYLEDGMTRFIGIFYGENASRVGPIRSARPFDHRVMQMYNAIFTFAYADSRVMNFLLDSPEKNYLVIQQPDNCPPLCRIGPDYEYNTLYADTDLLSQYVTNRGTDNNRQELSGLRFEEKTTISFGGRQVSRIGIRFSQTSYHKWDYDSVTKRFFRSQDLETRVRGQEIYAPLFDSLSEEQISTDNLIILLVPITYFFKSSDTEIYDINLTGTGNGYALREGRVYQVKWNRNDDKLVTLTMSNGKTYPLKPGKTWYEILGESSTSEINDLNWQFYFDIP
jgi:hypothetical protein